jgi:hypothetical protein
VVCFSTRLWLPWLRELSPLLWARGIFWLHVNDTLVRDQVLQDHKWWGRHIVGRYLLWPLRGGRLWFIHGFLHSFVINDLGEMMSVMAIFTT